MTRINRPGARAALALALVAVFAAPGVGAQGGGAAGKRGKDGPKPPAPGKETSEEINVPRSGDGFDLPPYRRVVFANGLVLLLMEQHESPIVDMDATVRSGSAADPAGKEGLASLTADLLTSGTATRSAEQVAAEVDFLGGDLDATADADTTVVSSEFLAKNTDKQIDLFSDVLLRPAFAPEEVDRAKQQRAAEIESLPEDARAYANAQFESAVFAGTPYGHPAFGLKKTVDSMTRDDVQKFYQSSFAPDNTVLAVVGDFKTDEMLAQLRTAFGGWERRGAARGAFAEAAQVKGRHVVLVDHPGLTQTQIRIGAVGIARNDPAYYAIEVANAALGGGFTSRLVDEIRVNRSLSYGAGSRFSARLHPGSYLITTFTKNATARETIDVALEVLKKFRDAPMPDDELKKSKNYLLGQYALTFETPSGLAGMIATIEVYGLPRDYVETFAQKVRALTPAEITAAIQRYFQYDNIIILLFTDASKTRSQFEGLGPIEVHNYLE